MPHKIVLANENRLFEKSRDVAPEEFGEELAETTVEMAETMYLNNGVGLAAPQVGDQRRILVADVEVNEKGENYKQTYIALINPVILKKSDKLVSDKEGCLSFPGMTASVKRPFEISVRYRNLKGEFVEKDFVGFTARIIQHEIDHLNGVTLFDYSSKFKRKRYLKSLEQ